VALLNTNNYFSGANDFNNSGNEFYGDTFSGNSFSGTDIYGDFFSGQDGTAQFAGDGSQLINLSGTSVNSGTVADARLSSNVALLNASKAFTGSITFSNATTTFATGAGNAVIRNDSGVVPGLDVTGGIVSGHMRFRNYLEIFPNDTATAAGGLDVRNTNGNPTITLNGANGSIACSNVIANGVLLTSDRNAKENFTPLDGQTVLAKVATLPITQWNYKANSGDIRHVGPMAQDFHDAFGLDGADDKHISVVDEGGVALAAIQGLNEKLEARSEQLETENVALKARLEKLEQLMTEKLGGAK
jgi:hypothetical protein